MTYYVLKENGQVVSRSTVQKVINLELETTDQKAKCAAFTKNIKERMNDPEFVLVGGNLNHSNNWSKYNLEEDLDYIDEYTNVVSDKTVPADEDTTVHDLQNDTYVNMEVAFPTGDAEEPRIPRETKQAKDNDCKPVKTANSSPLLDSREYEVAFADGLIKIMRANVIAENLFAQVDEQGF